MAYFFKLPPITDLTIGQQAALNETNAIAISGGPGTGKSVVCLWRHIRNYSTDSNQSLLLTYTKTLETYLAASATSENKKAGDAVNRTYWWTTHHATRYDEIIIDEAQDVEASRYSIIKEHASLVSYGADDSQILYPDKATSEKQLMDLFDINKRYFLDENFRNSYQIMLFLKGLFCNNLIYQYILEDLKANGRIGLKPIVIITNNQMDKQKDTIIDIINEYKSDTHTIAILLPKASHVNKHYDFLNTRNIKCTKYHTGVAEAVISNVHVTTFKSSKGVEFDTVIIPGFDKMYKHIDNPEFHVTESDYYVAITRAKRNLYLICEIMPSFLERSEQQKLTYSKDIL